MPHPSDHETFVVQGYQLRRNGERGILHCGGQAEVGDERDALLGCARDASGCEALYEPAPLPRSVLSHPGQCKAVAAQTQHLWGAVGAVCDAGRFDEQGPTRGRVAGSVKHLQIDAVVRVYLICTTRVTIVVGSHPSRHEATCLAHSRHPDHGG